jgi:sortase A
MKKISLIIIIVGVLIFLVPVIGQITTTYLENKMMSDWKAGTVEPNTSFYSNLYNAYNKVIDTFSVEKQSEQKLTQDLENVSKPTLKSTAKPSKNSKPKIVRVKQKVIGIIEIPKIKVKLPIVEGVKKENLRVGIGHIPGTAQLGEVGNSALAGHRSYALGHFFNRLDEVVVGDEITILTKKNSYIYKVYEKLVVLPEDVSVINPVENKNIITLITCTPIRVATHRLIIHAILESK